MLLGLTVWQAHGLAFSNSMGNQGISLPLKAFGGTMGKGIKHRTQNYPSQGVKGAGTCGLQLPKVSFVEGM